MDKARIIKWGIIGAGDVCEKKSGPGFYKAPGSELAAISKRNSEAAADFAKRHNVSRWYTQPEELINDPEVDAVYIATPPHLHRKFAELAMRAGKPVLVEKPMATSASECDAMIECSIETGAALWVAYYRRGLEKFVKIKEAIDSGSIGEPRSVVVELSQDRARYAAASGEVPWRVNPATAGAGIIADMGSHMLDLIDWFLGPISPVSSLASNLAGDYTAEDIVAAAFTTRSAGGASQESTRQSSYVIGTALWDFTGRRETDRTVIRGSEGTIEYSCFDDAPVLIIKDGETKEMEQKPFPPHVHQPLIELINDEIRGGSKAPSTAASGARTNRVLEALVSGYYSRAKRSE
ncbi:MAG: Gfo/Idh/MocA family oxidoreductase [Spirochaetia bacterium]